MRKALLAFMAVVAAGCPKPQYPECKTDPDCADHGQVCINGFCRECREDSNCATHPDRPLCRDAVCPKGKACADGVCRAQDAAGGRTGGACDPRPIYFGYDDATLSPEARKALDAAFQCLQRTPFRRLVIAGPTD